MKTSDANYGNKKTGESIPSLNPDCPQTGSQLAQTLADKQMNPTFEQINKGWNAEPNAPEPRIEVTGT